MEFHSKNVDTYAGEKHRVFITRLEEIKMEKMTKNDIDWILGRRRANMVCPNCGSGDTWIIRRYQNKIRPTHEVYCQDCRRWVARIVDPEMPEDRVCPAAGYDFPDERESGEAYADIALSLIMQGGGYTTAYELKKAVGIEPKEEDQKALYDSVSEAAAYMVIQLGIRQNRKTKKENEGG